MEQNNVNYFAIVEAEELKDGERLFVEIEGKSIVIFNVNNELLAIDDTCTHDLGTLGDGELEGYHIVCPRHGARFDIRTGKALTLPAVTSTPVYPVRINNGMIEVGISTASKY